MRKMVNAVSIGAAFAVLSIASAEAGIMGKAAAAVTGEVVALAVSAVVALLAGALGLVFVRVARTFREAGEFLTVLGCALDDRRITREELVSIVKEGRDIFAVWK